MKIYTHGIKSIWIENENCFVFFWWTNFLMWTRHGVHNKTALPCKTHTSTSACSHLRSNEADCTRILSLSLHFITPFYINTHTLIHFAQQKFPILFDTPCETLWKTLHSLDSTTANIWQKRNYQKENKRKPCRFQQISQIKEKIVAKNP